jgi:NTP pyrophosphatase (non-canonical NTP hydrolase)
MKNGKELKLNEYQASAIRADRTPNQPLGFHLLGLFGEAGSLLSVAKKKQRDSTSYIGYTPHVVEELGDVLWYLAVVADRGGIKLAAIGRNLKQDFKTWHDGAGEDLPFRALQLAQLEHMRQTGPTEEFEKTLLDLASDIGGVLTAHQAGRLRDNQAALQGALVTVMRTLVKAADEAGVTLEEAASANLLKIFDRWPIERIYPRPLDEDALPYEQLPRKLTIDIFERDVREQTYVFQQSNSLYIGDRLTDNATEPDDYRFHDVFHYAYCAVLTWSPVVRALLRLKRKSDPKIDEAQDGARANLIEEGVATWIFGQAGKLGYLKGMKSGELSFDILKTIRQFVNGYEPERLPLWLWEEAILQGFEAFRFLQEHRRARLHIDMMQRRLFVESLPK